ncbi:hypothetical protein ACFWVC_20285 [Streptomyces sp. NPDC058691]|uniref:hypothetical protein n=1 Tax=Streptomyces sp. NPDC058691 TaxID=3346601 RepID=UPI00364C9A69
MLLEMTGRDLPLDTFANSPDVEAGSRTPCHAFGEGPSPQADRTQTREPTHDHDKWLVGLQTRTPGPRDIWLFYIVDEAFDADHAVYLALVRANSAPERAARDGALIRGRGVEVHQIHRDSLGHLSLVRCA